MNYSDYRFTLDVQVHQAQVSVPVTLNDTARKLYIGLTDGRKPYTINDGCRAVFAAKKPDGTTILNDCIIEKNTTIVYEFSKNTTNVEGIVNCEVRLYDAVGKELTSPQFLIVVDAKVVRDEEVSISESESTTISNLLITERGRVAAEEVRASAELAREKAEVVRSEAEIERVTAESGRCDNETARANSEALRVTAENARADAEIDRAAAEDARKEADEKRDDFLGNLEAAVDKIVETQEEILNGNAELIAKEEVIKAINETLLIANDLETDDPYKALSAAQGVVLNDLISDKVQIEGNYYNGSNTDYGPELMFSFVPKIIFIFKRIRTYSNTFVENISGGQIIVVPEMGLTTSDYAAEKVKVTLNGTIVSLETKGIITPVVSEVCNVQSYHYNTNHTQKIADKKEDGYGYWYYGIG